MDGSEGERDLVLIQTFFSLLWKLSLQNTSKHKNNLIYIIKQEGLYQNKVTLSLASIHNCKMAYYPKRIQKNVSKLFIQLLSTSTIVFISFYFKRWGIRSSFFKLFALL